MTNLPISVGDRLRRTRDERDFLPAALEIVETPASPAGRAIGATIIAFFLIALAWAVLGRIDVIATAPGRIVPTGRSKVIQPLEIGVVRAIHVQDGQRVVAGQVLVELDPTVSAAERNRLVGELIAARLDVARLTAMLSSEAGAAAAFVAPPGAAAAQIALARQLVASQTAEVHARFAALDRQAAQHEANRAAVAATVEKLTALLPWLRQRVETRKALFDRELGSKLNYIDAEQQLVEVEQELPVQRSRLAEADATLAATAEQQRQVAAELQRNLLSDLAQARTKADDLTQELVKAEQRITLLTLTAPIDGVVQQLAVHTVGGVVTPAEPLMTLVPADSRLEIEATVANADIGFVHAGQRAAIKVDTFDFTRYGLLHGTVLSVSPDAIGAAAAGGAADAAGAAPAVPRSGLAFTARISLDRTAMQVGDQSVELRPGMAVTAEIDNGSRRVIDYLLSPILRYGGESLRER